MDFSAIKGLIGGFPPWVLLLGGAAIGWVKSFWNWIYEHTMGYVIDRIKVSVTIEETDHKEAFTWVSMWMESKLRERKINTIRLQRKGGNGDYYDGPMTNEFELVPGYGFYYIWWKKKLLTFNTTRTDTPTTGNKASPLLRRMTLTIWGTRNRNLLLSIISEARTAFETIKEKRLKYYTQISDWWESHDMVYRPLETIYLPDEQLGDIIADFQKFFDSEEKYKGLGVPWRRSYLFEGPPGSGKSSFVQALGTYFKIPIYYLNLHEKIDSSGLQGLLNSVVPPCIVLIEDIDSVRAAKERKEEANKDKDKDEAPLKTSDLLNALDGLVATEKRIIIMTTNHPDRLDKALLRKGRTDRIFHIGYAEEKELKKFYERAKEHYPVPSYEEFRAALPEKCTIADAQGFIFEPKLDLTIFAESDTVEE